LEDNKMLDLNLNSCIMSLLSWLINERYFDMFICNQLVFNNVDNAIAYANAYYAKYKVILGIAEVN
jgi:hypothetical protein